MKTGSKHLRHLLVSIVVLLTASVTASTASAQCGLAPYKLQEEILAALQNEAAIAAGADVNVGTKYWATSGSGIQYTLWRKCTNPNFSAWNVNGSQNLPVLSAAIGLIRKSNADIPYPGAYPNNSPSGITYEKWWTDFLGTQVGVLPPGNTKWLRYFKGTELFSNVYDAHVVTAVIAVRYWARKNGRGLLEDYALRYLRANWAVYAMSAGTGAATRFNLPERTPTSAKGVPPAPNTQYSPWEPLQENTNNPKYNGHFLALPGARSDLKHWTSGDRSALLDRAIMRYPVSPSNEAVYQRTLLDYMKNRWTYAANNLYGLSLDDANALIKLIDEGTNASEFLPGGARPWLTGIRTVKTFRLMGWRIGLSQFRASNMEGNPNGNTPCMYAVTYDGAQKIATFLYLWWDTKKSGGYPMGGSRLLPGEIAADNGGGIPGFHPPMTDKRIPIPTTQPLFHVVLTAAQESFDEKAAPTVFPPYQPYDPWPFDPPSGDLDPPEN